MNSFTGATGSFTGVRLFGARIMVFITDAARLITGLMRLALSDIEPHGRIVGWSDSGTSRCYLPAGIPNVKLLYRGSGRPEPGLPVSHPFPQLNPSIPSLRDSGSAAHAATEARKRILPTRQAWSIFPLRRIRIWGFHGVIKARFEPERSPALPHRLWLGAERDIVVQRSRRTS